jgi:2-dehydro-3-deoxyglucarate aldolase
LRKNDVKRKLRAGLPSIGSWITIAHPSIAEIMALAGFDWLTIDTEHGAIGIESVQVLMQAISRTATVPLVRVGGSDRSIVTRVLDAGAEGIVFPMILTEDDTRKAVRSVKFPPEGTRGVGLARAHGYSEEGRDEYLKSANDELLVVIQVEHITAVDNIDGILAVEGIDAVYVGPSDLSASLGFLGQCDHPSVLKAIERVRSAARRAGVPLGIPANKPEEVGIRISEGYQFIQVGVDELFLSRSCREALKMAEEFVDAGEARRA